MNPPVKKEKKKVRRSANGERERTPGERSGAGEEQRFNLGTPRSGRSVISGTSRRRIAKSTSRTRDQENEATVTL